jgi:dTDP-4-dehydrorhamnose reductase
VENLFIIKKRFKFNFKLIQISTDQMYNNKVGLKSNENAKPIVLNEYTKQKLAVEKICLKNKALILRLNFFSNTKKNILGWVLNSCKTNENIYLFNDIYFNPLSVTTLSKIISKIVSKFFIKDINGIYNLGSKDNLNKSDFCKYIINKKFPNFKNYKVVSSKKFFKIKRPKNMTMNINKFEKKFNICLPYIKNEINNYLKNNVKI